tara:strand:+ start:189 stop:572 length:384 start_codon:yes stop_codon:yes gene_type:complete
MILDKDNPVQYQISNYIAGNLNRPITGLSDQSNESQCHYLFKNFRVVNQKPVGLRLTAIGHKLLARHFTATEFHLEEPIIGLLLVNLDKAMKRPYYLSKKKVAFYDEHDAAWFKLGGNNLNYFAGNL